MFTGIIETTAKVLERSENSLTITRPQHFHDLHHGMSIAINGACLSVAEFDENTIRFDVLSETFRKTNLGSVEHVNGERAMPANGRFEGHIVLGHVDGTVTLLEKKEEISGMEYIFSLPEGDPSGGGNSRFLVPKGSITLNGASLTIGNITQKTFSVFLIPITLSTTTFGSMKGGEKVNIEYDYLAKTMYKNEDVFDIWNREKKYTHHQKDSPVCEEGEIWWIQFGKNIGTEILGKGESFLRPALILKNLYKNGSFVIPLTSAQKNGSYYYNFIDTKDTSQCAIFSQIRYIDTKRLKYRLSRIPKSEFKILKEKFSQLILK